MWLHKMDETVKETRYIVFILPTIIANLVWTEVKHITVVGVSFTTVEIGVIKL